MYFKSINYTFVSSELSMAHCLAKCCKKALAMIEEEKEEMPLSKFCPNRNAVMAILTNNSGRTIITYPKVLKNSILDEENNCHFTVRTVRTFVKINLDYKYRLIDYCKNYLKEYKEFLESYEVE